MAVQAHRRTQNRVPRSLRSAFLGISEAVSWNNIRGDSSEMRKVLSLCCVCVFLGTLGFAADNVKESDRVQDAGQVLKEIVNIPDNIPKDLFDRAECVIVLPS